ncbi:hypothetical protein D9615_007055 [Tricholomella constricta]|uniref:Uncharacterized protein n=1 Tax=Tricholomella constricta TaxID=117010 RepID=A0A8H5H877_9AGAR|nr:hypothetical protein D9615_007055 [Tricholomella constricta]
MHDAAAQGAQCGGIDWIDFSICTHGTHCQFIRDNNYECRADDPYTVVTAVTSLYTPSSYVVILIRLSLPTGRRMKIVFVRIVRRLSGVLDMETGEGQQGVSVGEGTPAHLVPRIYPKPPLFHHRLPHFSSLPAVVEYPPFFLFDPASYNEHHHFAPG